MDKNLTYQKARRIRNTKVTDLLADQLLYEKSIGKAIGKTVSLKFQSKIKGIKEKFDPLNVAKFLTGGSKLAPALLGRMLGRDIRDIEYFTGRNRPIRIGPGKGTASKITPTPGEGGDIQGINEQLLKIYTFLKQSNEQDIKRREKEQNFKEEKEIEKEKRHKEFIDALKKLKTGKTTATAVSKKEEEKEGFDFGGMVEGIMSKIKDMVQGMIDSALEVYKWVKDLKILKDLVAHIGPLLRFLGSNFFAFLTGTAGTALLAIGGAAALLAYLASIEKEEIEKNPYAEKYKDNPYAMKLRGEAKTVGEAAAQNQAKATVQVPRRTIEDFVKSDQTDAELLEEFGQDRAGLKKWLSENPNRNAMYQKPIKGFGSTGGSSVAPMPDETDAETARLTRQNAAATPRQTQPKAEVVPQSTNSQVNTLMNQNAEANLPKIPNTQVQSVTNNLINNSSSQIQKMAKLEEIPVHNDEPTFLRMIMNSTRVV